MKYIVDIFDISYEGAGVGKLDGQVVFVPKSLPGERVEVEIVKKTNSYLIGKVVQVLQSSKERIAAKCPYFDVCGGCDFQHCLLGAERDIKHQILAKELKKVGFDGEIDFVPSKERFAYRNKIKMEVQDGKLGYFKAKSHEFFEVENCPIASEKINEVLPLVREFLSENHLQNLKNVYLKQVGEKVAICFLFDKNAKNVQKNIKNMQILDNFSVFFAFGDVLESDETKIFCVLGEEKLKSKLHGIEMNVDVSAFNQINDNVAERLYSFLCELSQNKRVVNAYSGQGLLTALMAQNAKFVYGIEMQKSAHLASEKLMENLKEYNVKNICGKVEDHLERVLLSDRVDMIVLDPSREGCKGQVLEKICSSKIQNVVYVSCNFASLVRDLKTLTCEYSIEKVLIFDMFPCTANMESVVVLNKR